MLVMEERLWGLDITCSCMDLSGFWGGVLLVYAGFDADVFFCFLQRTGCLHGIE